MVVSLYICEIPKNTIKKDIEDLFKSMEGYIETRMKNTNDRRKIAFVDFHSENEAKFAMNTYQGFKFDPDDRGLIIKFSDNTKTGQSQPKKERDEFLSRKRKYSGERASRSKYRNYSDENSSERDDDESQINNQNLNSNNVPNQIQHNSSQIANFQNPNNLLELINFLNNNSNLNSNNNNNNNTSQLIKNTINPLGTNIANPNLLLQQDSSLNLNPGNLNNIAGISPNLNVLNNNNSMANNNVDQQTNNNYNNLLDILHNIQTVQLLNSLTGQNNNSQNFNNQSNQESKNLQILNPNQNNNSNNALSLLSNHLISNQNLGSNQNNNMNSNQNNNASTSNSKSNSFLNSLHKYDDKFKHFLDFKKNATNIVYVEGLPLSATEREVAHIFRPFPGFKSVRIITRDKAGEKSVICFADFDDILQSTICINTLQGYRFDKNDLVGLHFSYGVSKQKK